MKTAIEELDKTILSNLLVYKEVAANIIDDLKEENSRLKKTINNNEMSIEKANTVISRLANSVEALEKECCILKKEIDKAEKERTLCYACSKNIEELSIPKPHVPGATEALLEFYKKEEK